jgi:ABC-type multidrug transport system permease subunit
LEGNIEQLTFHGFGELRNLCSFSFEHRVINVISVFAIFFVFFACFGLYLWLKVHYQKKAKIVTDAK